jgi:hypothetical protein
MNRESDNLGAVPYNFDPEYSIEKTNSRQHLIAETSVQPPPFLHDFHYFSERKQPI